MNGKKILNITAAAIPALLMAASGIAKLSGSAQVVEKLSHVGVISYIYLLGIMELIFAALYFFRPTMKAGFILIACYLAGAIATDLSHGESIASAAIAGIIVWIGAFVRDRGIFLQIKTEK